VEAVRMDLPHLGSEGDRRTHAEELRQAFLEAWNPEVIDQYLRDSDAKAAPRPRVALPWTATAALLPARYRVRWNGAREVPLQEDGEGVALEARGRRWRFARAAAP